MKKSIILPTLAVFCLCSWSNPDIQDADIMISKNWYIQAASKVDSNGSELSSADVNCSCDWYKASVPSTIRGDYIGFILLSLKDKDGKVVSENDYVLAEIMDKHNWKKYRWWRTQLESYGDFSALDSLAPAQVEVSGWNINANTFEIQ